MHDEEFCFRRLTVAGRVSRLTKHSGYGIWHGTCALVFWLTIERSPRPAKVLRCRGEIWGPQLALAEQIQEGTMVKLVGCLKPADLSAAVQLTGFDVEQVLEVAA